MDNNIDVLFLGGLFPKETESEIINKSKGNVQNAANNLQWEIVKGLNSNLEEPVKILNSLYIGSYPKRYKEIYIKDYHFSQDLNGVESQNIGFLNVTGIKDFSRYRSLRPYLKEWALAAGGKKKVVIAYAMTATFTRLLQYVKKINHNVVTCLIVPDLPQYMNLTNQNSKLYTILKKAEINQIEKNMKCIDSYVVLTEQMAKALKIEVPFIVVEGISTDLFQGINAISNTEKIKTILYTGALDEKYGILDLLTSFSKLQNQDIQLIICGAGDSENEIINASKKDKRINFKGLLKREEVLELQKSSTLLVNPRSNNEEYTKYSFPSKILEYMSSGTPVMAYKLEGMSEEYFDYMYRAPDHKEGLTIALKEVLTKPEKELQEMGQKAKEFVLEQKNGHKQTQKIIKMIKNI